MNYKFNLGNINIKGKALESAGIEQFQLENISVEITDANPMEMVQASREFFSLMKEAIGYFEEMDARDRENTSSFESIVVTEEDEARLDAMKKEMDEEIARNSFSSRIQQEVSRIKKEAVAHREDKSKMFWS